MKLLREPLLHFILIGAALAVLISAAGDAGPEPPREGTIRVTAGKVEHLASLFAKTWRRPPTRAELAALVDDFIREEAAYREGRALGLDRDDTIIRRRLRQKLDFVAEDLAALTEPTDADLAAYLEARPEQFRIDWRASFRHVYLRPEGRSPEQLDVAFDRLLNRLNTDPSGDASALGDRILLDHAYADLAERDVAGLFGPTFAAGLAEAPTGAWFGPIESAYGLHAVIVDARTPGRLPALEEVRDGVRREWDNDRRDATVDRFYAELIGAYDVVVDWPQGTEPSGAVTEPRR